jgi:hexosaminidase
MIRSMTMSALVLCAFAAGAAPRGGEPALLPAPAQLELGRGAFTVDAETKVHVSDDPQAAAVAHYFGDLLVRARGLRTEIVRGASSPDDANVIHFTLRADASASPDSYTLSISEDAAHVTAAQPSGLFYGAVTLWQLLTQDAATADEVRVPALRIVDAPRLRRRGVMLDSTVQHHSVEFIKDFIDALALHKLNVLQWRLAGDAAWRLEIAKRPQLTAALRAGARTFYTHDDVREIMQHAASRHVAIVPQFDMPGSASAAIVAYPELGARRAATGGPPSVLNIDESTFAFIRDVLNDATALFPAAHISIGGQAPVEEWTSSPQVQARMRELGLNDGTDVQRYFTTRVAELVQQRGRILTGPDSLMIGTAAGSTLIVSARGLDSALGAVSAGYETVVSSPTLDFGQPDTPNALQHAGPVVSTKAVYTFDPAPDALSVADRARLVGVQASLAAPSILSADQLEALAFPRAAALAEAAWTPALRLGWASFQQRLPTQMTRYRKLGVQYSDAVFRTLILVRDARAANRALVELSKQAALGEIRYTLNGAEPTASSQAYTDVFEVKTPAVIKAATFLDGVALTAPTTLAIDSAATAQR